MLKQHMKSFFALAMALLLALGTLSACTITWESGKTNDASSDQAEALAEAQQDGGEALENLTIDTEVELNDQNTTVTGAGVDVENGKITVTKPGTYSFKGTLSDGQIIVNTAEEGKVKLLLNGVSIHSETSAPILILSSPKETKLLLAAGSENTLSDSANRTAQETDDPDAVIWSKDDIEISGTGTLKIEANYARGIVSKDTLQISGGTLDVAAADDALRGKEGVEISGGVLTLNADSDGIQANDEEKGTLTVSGGVLTLNTGKDGLQAAAALEISGGVLEITSGSDALKGAADVTVSGGSLEIDAGSDGIHADGNLTLSGGSVKIKQSEEGLEGTSVTLSGSSVDITASDDGINAASPGSSENDFMTAGNKTGNVPELPAEGAMTPPTGETGNAPEPPAEGAMTPPTGETGNAPEPPANGTMTPPTGENGAPQGGFPGKGQGGGRPDFERRAQNGDNANGENGTQQGGFGGGRMGGGFGYDASAIITISGGSVTVNAGGDGLDSNGDITMTGGSVIGGGPTNSGNSALDYGGTFDMAGGTLLAVGAAGMAQSISSGLAAIAANCEIAEGGKVEIQTADGKTLTSFTAPKKISHLVYADSEVKADQTYSIVVNGTATAQAVGK